MADLLERFASMSVLIVNDNEANVAPVRALLENQGLHRIASENDPRRVAGRLAAINPDLVLLDLLMPHLDGHTVLEQVVRFAACNYLPVLVLTADESRQGRDRALSAGARDLLTKPLDIAEFGLRVANLLETRQLHVALRNQGTDGGRFPQPADADLPRVRTAVETVLRDAEHRPRLPAHRRARVADDRRVRSPGAIPADARARPAGLVPGRVRRRLWGRPGAAHNRAGASPSR